MHKIILVIGEVTRDQYQELRILVLHEGHLPKIVRLSADEFFLDSESLWRLYATPEQKEHELHLAMHGSTQEEDEASIGLTQSMAAQHLQAYDGLHSVLLGSDVVDQYHPLDWMGSALAGLDCPVWTLEGDGLLVIG
ncbi:MAG: hypothetical protein JWN82_225 [Candidatus Saccharibacteria bacterium]|nr:hypothetical protein [Candidatus Saccharibacteria bacterium]